MFFKIHIFMFDFNKGRTAISVMAQISPNIVMKIILVRHMRSKVSMRTKAQLYNMT